MLDLMHVKIARNAKSLDKKSGSVSNSAKSLEQDPDSAKTGTGSAFRESGFEIQ
jgi:hypothetical protein